MFFNGWCTFCLGRGLDQSSESSEYSIHADGAHVKGKMIHIYLERWRKLKTQEKKKKGKKNPREAIGSWTDTSRDEAVYHWFDFLGASTTMRGCIRINTVTSGYLKNYTSHFQAKKQRKRKKQTRRSQVATITGCPEEKNQNVPNAKKENQQQPHTSAGMFVNNVFWTSLTIGNRQLEQKKWESKIEYLFC